jgi:hypothetical protein
MEQQRRRACRRFGWTSLLAWAVFGLALETLHGWKVGRYLDDALARELLVLAHAHGVGLAIVVLAFGEAGAPLFGEKSDGGASLLLRIGAVLVPAAFALSAIDHPEGDPNLLVWLVPLGAAAIVAGLARTAYAAWRA